MRYEFRPPAQWQLQEAKQKFSEVVRRALSEGPQVVTRNGEEAVVVVGAAEYRRLQGEPESLDFEELLLSGPPWSDDLVLERDPTPMREINLEGLLTAQPWGYQVNQRHLGVSSPPSRPRRPPMGRRGHRRPPLHQRPGPGGDPQGR